MSRIFEALQHATSEPSCAIDGSLDSPQEFSSRVTGLLTEPGFLEEAKLFRLPDSPAGRLVAWREPNCLASENFRVLSARLRHARQRGASKSILVTSPVRGDGKSLVSANLAIALASHGEKTLLLEGDLHRPSLAATFSLDGSCGFSSWHEKSTKLSGLVYRADGLPLWFIPAGVCQQQPLTLIQSAKTLEFMQQLADVFTWIVVDSPPLVSVADSGIWTTICDAVLLVARDGVTPKGALLDAVESIDKSKLFAVIMNDAQSSRLSYYSAYYSMGEKKPSVPSLS